MQGFLFISMRTGATGLEARCQNMQQTFAKAAEPHARDHKDLVKHHSDAYFSLAKHGTFVCPPCPFSSSSPKRASWQSCDGGLDKPPVFSTHGCVAIVNVMHIKIGIFSWFWRRTVRGAALVRLWCRRMQHHIADHHQRLNPSILAMCRRTHRCWIGFKRKAFGWHTLPRGCSESGGADSCIELSDCLIGATAPQSSFSVSGGGG